MQLRDLRRCRDRGRGVPGYGAEQAARFPQPVRLQPMPPSRTGARVVKDLRVPALQISQGRGREVYSFGIDGKILHRIAAVSRVGREDDASIRGYQRPEVLAHIQAIRSYLESPSPMIP